MRSLVAALALALVACSSEEGVDPLACGSLSDDVPPADFVWAPEVTPPEATGGVPAGGTYYLVEEAFHGADPACEDEVTAVETRSPYARQALEITAETDTSGKMELVTTVHADPIRAAATYTVVDETLTFANVCGSASPFPQGVSFSAEADDLWVFPALASCGPVTLHFVRLEGG